MVLEDLEMYLIVSASSVALPTFITKEPLISNEREK